MPRAVKVTHHGKIRWRVIIPPEAPGARRKVRLFTTRDEAQLFASGLSGLRDGALREFMRLDQPDRARLLWCLSRCGGLDQLESAVSVSLTSRPATDKPLSEAMLECVESKRAAGSSWQYVSNMEVALGLFERVHPGRTVASITGKEIEAWLNANEWAQETRRTYLRRLKTFYVFAIRRNYCVTNPVRDVQMPTRHDGPIHILTPDECKRLLETCREIDPGLLPYFATGLFAGIRPDEIKRLRRENVRSEWIEVEASKSKSRRRRLVAIQPTLAAWLKVPGGGYGWTGWKRRARKVRSAAGVTWHVDVMRHSFCSYSLPIHGASKTSEWAGHSEAMLFRHYRELVTTEAAREFWAVMP